MAAEAEADGLPFSAACQSWKVSDFEARTNDVEAPSVGRERLDAVWKLMLRHHVDPTLACLDWPTVHAQQVKELGPDPKLGAVDAAFKKVFGQLGPEAPRFTKQDAEKPAAAPADRPRLRKSEVRLTGYDAAGQPLPAAAEGKQAPQGPRRMSDPIEIPEGMAIEWWALGAWSVQNVKQIEGAFRAIPGTAQERRGVLDLRETSGTSMRSGMRMLNSCATERRMIGEISDRSGKRELKIKPNDKTRTPSRLIVLTSERSSAVSQLVAYSAVTECGATWFYETQQVKPKRLPAKARRPMWSERAHPLPGGGQLWTRSASFDLQSRVAGPTPEAELRKPSDLTPTKLAAILDKKAEGDAP